MQIIEPLTIVYTPGLRAMVGIRRDRIGDLIEVSGSRQSTNFRQKFFRYLYCSVYIIAATNTTVLYTANHINMYSFFSSDNESDTRIRHIIIEFFR